MQKTILALLTLNLFAFSSFPQENMNNQDSLAIRKKATVKAAAFTTAYYAGSLYFLSKTWFDDKQAVPFHFYNDNRGYLQIDKFGHSFGAYVYSYIGYHYLLHIGYPKKEALLFGSTLGLILQIPVEILDGFHEDYGFSWGDMAANTLGSALVAGQELLFSRQVVKYKYSYRESVYSRQANGYLGKNFFDKIFRDYNGHTYWLSFPVHKLAGSRKIPPWLNVSIGYSANGMFGEFENIREFNGVPIPESTRYRQYLLSLDIDWTQIKTDSKLLKMVFTGLTFIKLPFPALEYNSMQKFKGYWLYY
jgi:hypothetical protein